MATSTKSTQKKSAAAPKKSAGKSKQAAKAPKSSEGMLQEFFADELKDIYGAEKHLVKTLPKMKKAATSTDLQQAFVDHLEATKGHVTRLEQAFGILGKKPQAKKCDAMAGLTEEGDGIIEETEAGTATRDVGLILAAQKVEHYEIASYGTLRNIARTLGHNEVADLLQQTLDQEGETDHKLTELAEAYVNEEASVE